jgi:hypothetical protein
MIKLIGLLNSPFSLHALKRNVEAERSIILNKLVEVDRRIELARRASSSN